MVIARIAALRHYCHDRAASDPAPVCKNTWTCQIFEMGVPDATVFWLALAALLATTLAAPDHFDQRQTGQYNVRIQLKELKIVAVAMPDGDDEGDYDEGNYDYEDPVDPLEHHTKSTTPKTTTTKTTTTSATTESIIPSSSPLGEPNDGPQDSVDSLENNTTSTTPKTMTSTTPNAPALSPNGGLNGSPLNSVKPFVYHTKATTLKPEISTITPNAPALSPNEGLNGSPLNSAEPLGYHTKSTTPKTTTTDTRTTTTTTTTIPSALASGEPNGDSLPSEASHGPVEMSSFSDSLNTTSTKNTSKIPPTETSVDIALATAFWSDLTSFNDVATTVDEGEPNSTTNVSTDSSTVSEATTAVMSTATEATTTKRLNNKFDPTKRIRARVRCRPGYSKDRSGLCRKTRITIKPVDSILS